MARGLARLVGDVELDAFDDFIKKPLPGHPVWVH